jgi:hypothetical protein
MPESLTSLGTPALCALAAALSIFIAILSVVIGGQVVLFTLDPKHFAEIIVLGRPIEEIFYVTARYIAFLSESFRNANKEFEATNTSMYESAAKFYANPSIEIKEIIIYVTTIQNHWRKSHTSHKKIPIKIRRMLSLTRRTADRLDQIKSLTARELHISQRKLCDHIYQFSVLLFRDRIEKYIENYTELETLLSQEDINMIPKSLQIRIYGLVAQCYFIQKTIYQRKDRGSELAIYREYHRSLLELASSHSATASIRKYAFLLHRIVRGQHYSPVGSRVFPTRFRA